MVGNARSGCAPRKVVRCYWRPNLKHSRITVNILPSLIIQLLENFRTLVWAGVFKILALLINGLPAGAADTGQRAQESLPRPIINRGGSRPSSQFIESGHRSLFRFFPGFSSTAAYPRFKPILHAVCQGGDHCRQFFLVNRFGDVHLKARPQCPQTIFGTSVSR
jgi:hypothetical protein